MAILKCPKSRKLIDIISSEDCFVLTKRELYVDAFEGFYFKKVAELDYNIQKVKTSLEQKEAKKKN